MQADDQVAGVRSSGFGARGDGRHDDYRALQRAIDTACEVSSGTVSGAKVHLPSGSYSISAPLLLRCSGLVVSGDGKKNTEIKASFAGGPMLVLAPPNYPAVTTADGLFGDGRALHFPTPSTEGYVLALRAAPTMDLDGLPALTVEFTVRFSRLGYNTIIGSGDFSGKNRAIEIIVDGKGAFAAYLTVGGKQHYVAARNLDQRTGVNYHVALVYARDAISLYWNGRRVASQPASGSITQRADEGMTLGGTPKGPPGMGLLRGVAGGVLVQSVRISKVGRYFSDFQAPRRPFRNDADTLLLLNFDRNPGIFTIAESNAGDIWLPRMDMRYTGAISFATVSDLQLSASGTASGSASGILAIECDQCSFDRVLVAYPRIGVQFFNNSYRSHMSQPKVIGGTHTWIDFLEDVSSGPVDLTDAHFDGGQIGCYSGGGGIYSRVYISVSTAMSYPFYLVYGSSETAFTLIQPSVDFEPAGPPRLISALYLNGIAKATIIDGIFEAYGGSPIFVINGGENITLIGTELNSGGNDAAQPSELIRIESAPRAPIQLVNPQIKSPGRVRLTNDPLAVSVVGGISGRSLLYGGGLTLNQLDTPGPPTVTAEGSGTNYTYFIVARDLAGNSTLPSRGTTVSGGATPRNRICAKPQRGAYYFDVLRGSTQQKVGTISPFRYTDSAHDYCIVDSTRSPSAYATPVRNSTGDLTAPVIFNGCSGVTRLLNGFATVTNPCITGARPIGCTDNTPSKAASCNAVPALGRLRLYGERSNTVSWFQL
jgi:hypothetical protein